MNWLYKLLNKDKIDELNKIIDIYKERNEQLEKEVSDLKSYKLKYEVTKLYVEDDDALLELFDMAKLHDKNTDTIRPITGYGGRIMGYGGYGGGVSSRDLALLSLIN